jgi:hypothetical protein
LLIASVVCIGSSPSNCNSQLGTVAGVTGWNTFYTYFKTFAANHIGFNVTPAASLTKAPFKTMSLPAGGAWTAIPSTWASATILSSTTVNNVASTATSHFTFPTATPVLFGRFNVLDCSAYARNTLI